MDVFAKDGWWMLQDAYGWQLAGEATSSWTGLGFLSEQAWLRQAQQQRVPECNSSGFRSARDQIQGEY